MLDGRLVELGKFNAVTEGGQAYLVYEYQRYSRAGTLANPRGDIPEPKEWRTSTGLTVKRVDAERYVIVETTEIIRQAGHDSTRLP